MASDNRLVYCDPIPRLQDMAAFKVALDLWLYYVECELSGSTNAVLKRECVTESYRTREAEIRHMTENLNLPKIIEGSIKKCVKSICAQVLSLSAYCRDFVFFDRMAREHLSDVVWRPDGTIDCEKIIRKVIKSERMNERQKFVLMCEYCMEEDIGNAWLKLQDHSFVDEAQLDKNPIIVYWDCLMKGDFSKMGVNDVTSAHKHILENFRSCNLRAVEYFFNRVGIDDRIGYGIRLIKNGGARMAKFLIPKYSEEEQLRLLNTSNFFIKLIKIFATSNVNYALQTWMRVRYSVNGEQFVQMLRKVGYTRIDNDQVHQLLVEIWRCSPVHLKNFVYSISLDNEMLSKDGNFLYGFCIKPYYVDMFGDPRQREDAILIELLIDAEPKYRKNLWKRYWVDLVVRSRPGNLRKIIQLCLSEEEVTVFKSNMMSCDVVLGYFTDLIANGRYSDLDEFLKMFVGEGREMNEMKRQLLEGASNTASIIRNCDQTEASVTVLREFLTQVFENDENSLLEFEKKLILACITPPALCSRYELVRIFGVSERLCSEQTLVNVKEELLQKCKAVASEENYSQVSRQPEWSMMLMWCLGNEEKVAEFEGALVT